MADRWFRVPTKTVERTDREGNVISSVDGPKYRTKSGIAGFSGNTIGNSPRWVVRFYGDESTLDEIAAESDAMELTAAEAARRFSNATGQPLVPDKDWDETTVNESFEVSE